ncbi:unnamed protein product [Owenia fusiformis]|uniref:Protein with SprT-like domain at the N terminus n=1 Tax=Owenia fusiformis TaxID=6347 RepID=A0A8J1U684_OWEFU|nr:unnamed protein product [Owenia fusiformis]
MEFDNDFLLALQLQEEMDSEKIIDPTSPDNKKFRSPLPKKGGKTLSIVDPQWELIDPVPDIHALFQEFNATFFWRRLEGIEVKWSPRMTLCAGVCSYEGHGGLCSVRLSVPLLKLRPRKDLVETLLHEMIHAYLFVTDNNKDHDGHGPEFQKHMNRINNETGSKISIYHTFHDEVDQYRQHWWRCDGPCITRKPYFGYVRRAMNRAPSPRDPWWGQHQATCGGTYVKIKEPEGYGKKKTKEPKESKKEKVKSPVPAGMQDIRTAFTGKGHILTDKPTGTKDKGSSQVVKPIGSTKDFNKDIGALSKAIGHDGNISNKTKSVSPALFGTKSKEPSVFSRIYGFKGRDEQNDSGTVSISRVSQPPPSSTITGQGQISGTKNGASKPSAVFHERKLSFYNWWNNEGSYERAIGNTNTTPGSKDHETRSKPPVSNSPRVKPQVPNNPKVKPAISNSPIIKPTVSDRLNTFTGKGKQAAVTPTSKLSGGNNLLKQLALERKQRNNMAAQQTAQQSAKQTAQQTLSDTKNDISRNITKTPDKTETSPIRKRIESPNTISNYSNNSAKKSKTDILGGIMKKADQVFNKNKSNSDSDCDMENLVLSSVMKSKSEVKTESEYDNIKDVGASSGQRSEEKEMDSKKRHHSKDASTVAKTSKKSKVDYCDTSDSDDEPSLDKTRMKNRRKSTIIDVGLLPDEPNGEERTANVSLSKQSFGILQISSDSDSEFFPKMKKNKFKSVSARGRMKRKSSSDSDISDVQVQKNSTKSKVNAVSKISKTKTTTNNTATKSNSIGAYVSNGVLQRTGSTSTSKMPSGSSTQIPKKTESEPQASMVPCPVCGESIKSSSMNEHLDNCLN